MNVLRPYEQRIRMDLYEQGLNDREIARYMGVSTRAICYWRESCELPPNGKAGRKKIDICKRNGRFATDKTLL